MGFDAQAAKKAGYSDQEIADYLGQQQKFDVSGARKAGYADADIVAHLTSVPQSTAPKASEPAPVAEAANPATQPRTMSGDFQAGLDKAKTDVTAAPMWQTLTGVDQLHGLADIAQGGVNALGAGIGSAWQGLTHGASLTGKGNAPIETKTINGQQFYRYNGEGDFKPVPTVRKPDGSTDWVKTNSALEAVRPNISTRQTQDTLGNATANLATFAVDPALKAVGAGAKVIGSARAASAASKVEIPSVEALQSAKTAAYKHAESVGAIYGPQSVQNWAQGLSDAANEAGLDADLNPKAHKIISKVEAMAGQPASFSKMENVRKLANLNLSTSDNAADRFFGHMIKDHIDDFMDNAGPEHMTAGDPVAQTEAINNARKLNVAYKKVEAINEALGRADMQAGSTGSGGNIDNATRQKLRGLLYNRKMRWTDDEKTALEGAIKGGNLHNVLRLIGKLSPEGNGLMLTVHAMGAASTHGSSLPAAAVGALAKRGADAITRGNVDNVLRKVVEKAPPLSQPAAALAPSTVGAATKPALSGNVVPLFAAQGALPNGVSLRGTPAPALTAAASPSPKKKRH